ncbi:hypothetical protein B481_2824 [Planococcus halocryophilus Or1]|nr:hypothetical protein [Planococcus halocryophilus]EMF45591.1 hypothetical protein B481_2824 [Planococcus halocryophilus Or1]
MEAIRKVDEEELYDHLEENGLLVVIEEDFPELKIIGDMRF